MEFEDILRELKVGNKVAREEWMGKGTWVSIRVPSPNSEATRPYLSISTLDGVTVPWLPSQTDILADDWYVVSYQAGL